MKLANKSTWLPHKEMIFQSSSLESISQAKLTSRSSTWMERRRMFKNFHSRTIIRFVLSIHHGHREEARGDVVQVSRPFFEDAHSNLLPLEMEEVRCLEESRSVFSHWNWIWTRGKRFESGNSRANVLAQESSGHEWKNCEPVFVQEDDRRKETRKHFSKEIEYQPAWFQTKLPGLIYRE